MEQWEAIETREREKRVTKPYLTVIPSCVRKRNKQMFVESMKLYHFLNKHTRKKENVQLESTACISGECTVNVVNVLLVCFSTNSFPTSNHVFSFI